MLLFCWRKLLGRNRKQSSNHFVSLVFSSSFFCSYIWWRKLFAKLGNSHQATTLSLSVYYVPTFSRENYCQGNNHSVSVCLFCYYICWRKLWDKIGNRQVTTLYLSVFTSPTFVGAKCWQKKETGKRPLCLCLLILLINLLEQTVVKKTTGKQPLGLFVFILLLSLMQKMFSKKDAGKGPLCPCLFILLLHLLEQTLEKKEPCK